MTEMNKQNVAIVGLLALALVLTWVWSVMPGDLTTNAALAGSMQASGGDYTITVARLSEGQEAIWLIDGRNQTLGVYTFDTRSKELSLEKTLSLSEVSAAAASR